METLKSVPIYDHLFSKSFSELKNTQAQLRNLPPLIEHSEISILIESLKDNGFILQIGDCAERFSEATSEITQMKYEQIIFLKKMLETKLELSVIPIGRIAGQYAKPRSAPMEIVDSEQILAYHGDIINAEMSSHRQSRIPDPSRMLTAYDCSKKILSSLSQHETKVYSSHECFLLEYEYPLTRVMNNIQYGSSAHLLWLGMRNLESDKHISYLSQINNPIAIKVSSTSSVGSVLRAIKKINPENHKGKIVLVMRLGYKNVASFLPSLIQAVSGHRLNVIWVCDPLHGNTQVDGTGLKYRVVDHMVDETLKMSEVLALSQINLGGIHLEASPRSDIQECIMSDYELTKRRQYDSALDPRLNAEQCIYYLEKVSDGLRTRNN